MTNSTNRIVVNTGIMYIKMMLTVSVNLYSTKIILNVLGSVDFGIFNLIAGAVAMLSFLNVAMTVSTQRFLSFYQGTKDTKMQIYIFKNSLFLHICLGILLLLAISSLRAILFEELFNISSERIVAATFVYHFMTLSLLFNIISIPFIASINSHENMILIAIVNIAESLLKLFIALLFTFKTIKFDNLIFYGFSLATISFISLILYIVFAVKRYPECSLNIFHNIKLSLLKKLGSYAGWNLFGALCGVGRVQGIAVILNIFMGTAINAAYGVANQVSAQLTFFSATMLRAINPQIMQSEGMKDRERMLHLSLIACKFGFFLVAFFAIPSIFEMNMILHLWLTNVPEYTKIFCQLFLVGIMVNQLTIGLQSAIQATGKIKYYQIIIGSIILLNLPIAYILLKKDYPAYCVIVAYILIELIACCIRLFFLKKIAHLSIRNYINLVFKKIIITSIPIVFFCFFITYIMEETLLRLSIILVSSSLLYIINIYNMGLTSYEKLSIKIIKNKIKNKIRL